MEQLVDARKRPTSALSDDLGDAGDAPTPSSARSPRAPGRCWRRKFWTPHHRDLSRHPDRGDGRGGRRRTGLIVYRHHRRVRCLARLSQVAGIAEPKEAVGAGRARARLRPNMLGSAPRSRAIVFRVKNHLAVAGIQGRVRYYGCPARRAVAAKTFMVRAGHFDDVDIAINGTLPPPTASTMP